MLRILSVSRRGIGLLIATAILGLSSPLRGDDGAVQVTASGTNLWLRVQGDKDDEWRFEHSADLSRWSNAPALGTAFSGKKAQGTLVSAGSPTGGMGYFRAVQTEGLFDPNVLRTISLTFTQANWLSQLKAKYGTGSNLLANLVMNGQTNYGVGVRYRGNTSYMTSGTKKSLNIEMDYTDSGANLMGYKTLNVLNANTDESIMRESVYFNVMRTYTICPRACLVKLYINNDYWGVYSFVQQEDGELIKEYCPSSDGDRWRAPNMGGGGGGGGGGGFGGGNSALTYLGTNVALYKSNYERKTDHLTNAWELLRDATYVLNKTATNELRDKVEEVLAVDRWLWFLAIENLFTDEDSYYSKGADYVLYYEPESGRIHPVEHDGNETSVTADTSLSPVQGATSTARPVLQRLLSIPELRQRYLAHLRAALEESFQPAVLYPAIDRFQSLSVEAIAADPKKNYTMAAYTNDVKALKTFVQKRYAFLTNHAEVRLIPPTITAVYGPSAAPTPAQSATITAQVEAAGGQAVKSVWLYHRPKSYGRFTAVQMFDDGAHGDGAAGDGVYGGETSPYPAGTKVRYYIEARAANQAARFAPARAEEETYRYRVAMGVATDPPVIVNELQADNKKTVADPQGEYDDWIELRNTTNVEVDMSGRYLTNDPTEPRKWAFPDGTKIAAGGYLLVWADEDGKAPAGLHANFKLAAAGDEFYLVDTDANDNAILDHVAFGAQKEDRSYGRLAADPNSWGELAPTPGAANN